MQHMRFMVLTGHLDDYSLPGLFKMLHGQRKTGRLQIDYAEAPAAFYFEDGRLVDARIGDLRGLEAVYLALSLAGASFNFNPLIKPPERTVEEREQKLIEGLLEAPSGGGGTDITELGQKGRSLSQTLPATVHPSLLPAADSQSALPTRVEERLIAEVGAVLASHSKRFGRERAIYATIIAALLALTFISRMRNDTTFTDASPLDGRSEVGTPAPNMKSFPASDSSKEHVPDAAPTETREAVRAQSTAPPNPVSAKNTGRPNKLLKVADAPAQTRNNESKKAKDASAVGRDERIVKVLLRVERGRVLQAVVQNSSTELASYEALALRIARQRQYPADFSGRDVLQLKVKP
jgi:hypothetical protein